MLVLNISSVAVLWFGAQRIDAGEMQIGALTAFLTYLVQILMSVMMATFLLLIAPRAAVCAERIEEVLGTASSVVPPTDGVTRTAEVSRVRFDHVEFTYPGADSPVLSDVTFTAAPGRTTAIIGSTGSGKTTLVSLVPRLFDATAGTVEVDGVDVRELEPEALWSRVGLVPQRAFLFTGTVAEQPSLRPSRRDRRRAVGGAARRAGRGLRPRHARAARGADLAGRGERLRWSAPTPRHRPGPGQAA